MKEDKNRTRIEYLKRVTKVLDYIEANLDSELSLEYLSKIANYSPFHFHRVFSAIIAESLNQYVIRKRLERIASILITQPSKTIKNLAYSYGFKSESSFSRAFKKYYGVSPTKFKIEGKNILSKIGIEQFSKDEYIDTIDKTNKWIKMNSKIIFTDLKEIRLAGISHVGEIDKMSVTFQKLMTWAYNEEVIDSSNFKALTIYHDNPNVTPISKIRYSACITISTDFKEHEDIRSIVINGGIYIIARFEINAEQISNAWRNMNIWIIENGYQFRDSNYFEIYHNDHTQHPENKFIIDICIPIQNTENVNLEQSVNAIFPDLSDNKKSKKEDYHLIVSYMKELRAHFGKEYELDFKMGKINQSSKEYTYFSLTSESLKKIKLKFVIIYDHLSYSFDICLSGQNKSIRKKFWQMFKGSDWDKYHIAESIDNSLMIIDHTLVERANFRDTKNLTQQVEKEALIFINAGF